MSCFGRPQRQCMGQMSNSCEWCNNRCVPRGQCPNRFKKTNNSIRNQRTRPTANSRANAGGANRKPRPSRNSRNWCQSSYQCSPGEFCEAPTWNDDVSNDGYCMPCWVYNCGSEINGQCPEHTCGNDPDFWDQVWMCPECDDVNPSNSCNNPQWGQQCGDGHYNPYGMACDGFQGCYCDHADMGWDNLACEECVESEPPYCVGNTLYFPECRLEFSGNQSYRMCDYTQTYCGQGPNENGQCIEGPEIHNPQMCEFVYGGNFSNWACCMVNSGIQGDVNRDWVINIMDVMAVIHHILGMGPPLDWIQQQLADINNDGNVDIVDAVGIVQMALNNGMVTQSQADNIIRQIR